MGGAHRRHAAAQPAWQLGATALALGGLAQDVQHSILLVPSWHDELNSTTETSFAACIRCLMIGVYS